MKKLVLGALVVALMSFGLLGGATTAHADPYPGTVVTDSRADFIKVNKRDKAKFAAHVEAGSATPQGTLRVVCKKIGSKVRVKSDRTSYHGVGTKVKSPRLKRAGLWKCKVKFRGAGVYKDSKVVKIVRVR